MIEKPSNYAENLEYIEAERCIAELQRGRAVVLRDESQSSPGCQVIHLVETLSEADLDALTASHACKLVISRSRALALDLLVDSDAVCLELTQHTDAQSILTWAGLIPGIVNIDSTQVSTRIGGTPAQASAESSLAQQGNTSQTAFGKAALNLARYAHALPAFIMHEVPVIPTGVLHVNVNTAKNYRNRDGELLVLSRASVPLATAENVELTVFRERHSNAEHVAITVGKPDLSAAVAVRLHSSCFTGDILGSMKCDCGEQLQRAIVDMAQGDGGVVLYLSQEGRGIGLASKLLAYQLQDSGMDTIDANQHLGFESDERQYSAAVSMLEALGIRSIRLMTNNPLKIEALREQGVNVDSRIPSPATINVHNARYLKTKRERAGHLASCESAG